MNESVSHEVHAWVEGLTEDELNHLSKIVHACVSYPAWGAQMLGIIQGERRRRFGYCVVCGVNHEKEHENLIKSTPLEGTPIPGSPFKVGDADAFSEVLQKNLLGMTYPQFLEKCAEFNVKPQGDQADPVFCRNCNMRYITLEDRMMKSVDDCDGCHQMTKTGQRFPDPEKQ
jgi:hypothetical protein